MKKTLPFIALTASAFAQNQCAPTAPTCYTPDDCQRCYCLGPTEIIANAPVCPYTCDGDITITVAGFAWKADEDGLEYAIDNSVSFSIPAPLDETRQQNNLINAQYLTPDFKWNFGFKIGVSYCSPCDGWDIGVLWTNYRGKASSHDIVDQSSNHALLPLWSAFVVGSADVQSFQDPIANEIQTSWNLDLDLIDIELGRAFWVSHYLSLRPHIGLRIGFLDQSLHLEHRGGAYLIFITELQFVNDFVELNNDFKGVGARGGIDTNWHLGCGWSLYGNLAASIVYGKFDIDHNEYVRRVVTPFGKFNILNTDESFRASRPMLDLALGVQWMGMVCDCKYGLLVALGWEQHLFFHQNQMWQVNRLVPTDGGAPLNKNGENDYFQRRGTLSTEGVTLTFRFTF